MTLTRFANVTTGPARPLPQRRRFVLFGDVLGMKVWLANEPASEIGGSLYGYISQTAAQLVSAEMDGEPVGPLLGHVLFSDSLMAYTVDDSWPSLWAITSFGKMLTSVALKGGIPVRGAISVGPVVMDRRKGVFVGTAISDAYACAELDKSYRGCGIEVTPGAVGAVQNMDKEDPHAQLVDTTAMSTDPGYRAPLLRFRDRVLVNHWSAEYTAGNPSPDDSVATLRAAWDARGLPQAPEHFQDTADFLRSALQVPPDYARERAADGSLHGSALRAMADTGLHDD